MLAAFLAWVWCALPLQGRSPRRSDTTLHASTACCVLCCSIVWCTLQSTYTSNTASFEQQLQFAVDNIKAQKLGVGLCDTCSKTPLSQDQLQTRFTATRAARVPEVDLWDWPIPDSWWQFVGEFVHN